MNTLLYVDVEKVRGIKNSGSKQGPLSQKNLGSNPSYTILSKLCNQSYELTQTNLVTCISLVKVSILH